MTNNRRKVISILGVVLTLAVFVGCTSNTTKEKDTEEIQKLIERVVEKGDEEFAVEYSYKKVSTFAEEKRKL